MAAPPKQPRKKIEASFFLTEAGNEPVREFLKNILPVGDRKKINADIRTVEYGWPIGMPTCRSLGDGLHEVRTDLENRISRVIFYVDARGQMILLHAFVKKAQATPLADLKLSKTRKAAHQRSIRTKGPKG